MEYIIILKRAVGKVIYSEEHRELVQKLKQARHKVALSQIEVARLLGRSQSYVSKIESGQRVISVLQLKEFARIYKAEMNYFIKEYIKE